MKNKLFDLASHKIIEFCDIAKLIKFQNHFDNFEKVLLNDNQIKAIKLMEKPILTSDLKLLKRTQTDIERNHIDEIIEYLEEKSKRKKTEKPDFDENIIKLICY